MAQKWVVVSEVFLPLSVYLKVLRQSPFFQNEFKKLKMLETIKKLAAEGWKEAVETRRHLHQNPELSFEEIKTGLFLAEKLEKLGIPFSKGWAGNGLVGILEGRNPSKKCVALRADFDALPITEANENADYRSQNAGIMHACGHDAHSASLLTTAKILFETRQNWEGTVKLIFQPAEEKLPGGASLMIAEGVLKAPKPTAIFGQHVHPALPFGEVGFCEGRFMASADELFLTIKGSGGHGAMPHETVDSVAVAAQIIVGLQQLVSRMADPTVPSVLTFGKINSVGGATNIIPEAVKMEGTFRTMDEKWRATAHLKMKKLAASIAEGFGAAVDFEVRKGYPVLFNDPDLTRKARKCAIEFLGKGQVHDLPIRMTAEDFAYFSQQMPACFYRLGTNGGADSGRFSRPVHTPDFDIDERALETGAGLMAWLCLMEISAK